MSRGVKDLRDMVCSSRQSVVSKSQDIASDEELSNRPTSIQSPCESLTSYDKLPDIINACGFQANDNATERRNSSLEHVLSVDKTTSFENTVCEISRHQNNVSHLVTNGPPEFLKSKTSLSHCTQSASWGSVSVKPGGIKPHAVSARQSCPTLDNNHESSFASRTSLETGVAFNEILKHLSKDIVQAWLERVKYSIIDASNWCQSGDNFVRFAHSWLSQYSEHTRNELLDLEFNTFKNQIQLAFRGKHISDSTLDSLVVVVLHEFANGRFLGHQGAYLFLDYMDILTSSRENQPRLLTDVHCAPTAMKLQYYEYLLGIRSFAMVGIWSALLDRFRDSEGNSLKFNQGGQLFDVSAGTRSKSVQSRAGFKSAADSPSMNHEDLNKERIFQAIRLGYLDVIQFMMDTQKISTDVRDSSNKTLVFFAAANNQTAALRYLLQQTDCGLYVNVSADSGNTPLHAAANRGDVGVTRELLKMKDIKVDACNHLCENATPLHLAAMHGHEELVQLLINAGANPSKKMGSKSVVEVATDFENFNIVELLRIERSTPRLS